MGANIVYSNKRANGQRYDKKFCTLFIRDPLKGRELERIPPKPSCSGPFCLFTFMDMIKAKLQHVLPIPSKNHKAEKLAAATDNIALTDMVVCHKVTTL